MTDYEYAIRLDERKRVWGLFAIGLIQRLAGVAIILATFLLARSGFLYDAYYGVNDTAFALFTIPIGLWLSFGRNIYKAYIA